jgi:DnaJ family protein C protein 2
VEDVRLAKVKEEEDAKLDKETAKKDKERKKKQIQKERKALRSYLKDFNYFAADESDKVKLMEDIEQLVDILTLPDIQKLNQSIHDSERQEQEARSLIFEMLKENQIRCEVLSAKVASMTLTETKSTGSSDASAVSADWTDEEVKLLVKGVKMFAVGTRDRWDVIANFIDEHSRGKFKRSGKEVLTKTKDLQKMDPKDKEDMNAKAYERTVGSIKPGDAAASHVVDKPSLRYNTPAEQVLAEQGSNPATWSPEEQKVLEQALKTYPASEQDRWGKIAGCIPTRSRKDCMVRYKELVDLIMAKKRASTAK